MFVLYHIFEFFFREYYLLLERFRKDYVLQFAAESFAYLLRKLKGQSLVSKLLFLLVELPKSKVSVDKGLPFGDKNYFI
jgi:hypothetical protein